jgi:hypothetical protein
MVWDFKTSALENLPSISLVDFLYARVLNRQIAHSFHLFSSRFLSFVGFLLVTASRLFYVAIIAVVLQRIMKELF